MGVGSTRVRGVLRCGVTWGLLWAAGFAALAIVIGVVRPEEIDAGEGPVRVGAIMGGIGLAAGVVFGMVLALAENGRRLRDMALARVALWGALASAAFPALSGKWPELLVLCPLGAAVAVALTVIARGAERRQVRSHRLRDVLPTHVLESMRDVLGPRADSRT